MKKFCCILILLVALTACCCFVCVCVSATAVAGDDLPQEPGQKVEFNQNPDPRAMTKEQLLRQLALKGEDIDRMSLRELRRQLKRRGIVKCDDCVEREHFREKLKWAVKNNVLEKLQEEKVKPLEQKDLPSGMDLNNLREIYKKKQKENDAMKEMLRKSGVDTSKLKFQNDADLLGKMFENRDL